MQSYHPEIKGTDSSSCCPEVLEQRRGEVRIDDFSRLVHDFQANLKNRLRLVEANIQTLFLILSQVFSNWPPGKRVVSKYRYNSLPRFT